MNVLISLKISIGFFYVCFFFGNILQIVSTVIFEYKFEFFRRTTLGFACVCMIVIFRYTYWLRYKVPFVKNFEFPFIFGNISEHPNKSVQVAEFYKKMKHHAIFGIYMLLRPMLVIADPKLGRSILSREYFQYFQDRNMYQNENDPLSPTLGTLSHDEWVQIKKKLTPAFSSAKIKEMFSIMNSVGRELVNGLNEMIETENKVEVRALFSQFTTEIIGPMAIGIQISPELREITKKAMQSSLEFPLNIFTFSNPSEARFFDIRKHSEDISEFIVEGVKQTIQYRMENGENRNDFIQLLIDAGLTTNRIAALAFDFLSAGYSDTTSTLSYCLYELSLCENREIQDKARDEIQKVLEQYDGELTYEALNQMNYCKLIIEETLRKHPVAGIITRIATEPFKVPTTDFTIPKGMCVIIPVYGLHHDEKFFPHSEMFIPERFSNGKIPAFMPFGEGPRRCIGSLFAKYLVRTALVVLLQHFEFLSYNHTQKSIKYSSTKNTLVPKDGIWINIKRIE